MNLHEQLGALEVGVDQLIQAVVAPQQAETTPSETSVASDGSDAAVAAAADAAELTEAKEPAEATPTAPALQPTLEINRPIKDGITLTIGGQTVALRPEQISELIEQLSNARASMTPEVAPGIPPGWRFVSTKNPVMAVQKQSNGDRLLVMRHTGHGWVPFSFSPDMVIQLYMMLTKG